jgi:hypothetical protein
LTVSNGDLIKPGPFMAGRAGMKTLWRRSRVEPTKRSQGWLAGELGREDGVSLSLMEAACLAERIIPDTEPEPESYTLFAD